MRTSKTRHPLLLALAPVFVIACGPDGIGQGSDAGNVLDSGAADAAITPDAHVGGEDAHVAFDDAHVHDDAHVIHDDAHAPTDAGEEDAGERDAFAATEDAGEDAGEDVIDAGGDPAAMPGARCTTDADCGALGCHAFLHRCGVVCDRGLGVTCPRGSACSVPGDLAAICLPTCTMCGADECGAGHECRPADGDSGSDIYTCQPTGFSPWTCR